MNIKAALLAVALGLGSTPTLAQMVIPLDLMPPYQAARIVRFAGLVPVAVPMRLGATYVVRAVDRFGDPVRVVIDGRDGEILAVRRIVAVQPPGYPYPPEEIPPRFDPYAGDPAVPPDYRAYPPRAVLRGEAVERQVRPAPRIAPNAATPNPAAQPRAALAPPRPPVPRARPPAVAPAEATAKPEPGSSRAAAPPASDDGEKAPAKPAESSFPPVQSLE